ncbi:heme-binding protein [Lentisphaerota bacterium ZTH]|nr:heme-binding protein [Lentisphaerota bacterium]WET06484.1 heme-binding protein [Lentisphaerota bacterium ZTH]
MKNRHYSRSALIVAMLCMLTVLTSCTTTEKAYERTPAGTVQVKKIPKLYAFSTTTDGEFFDNSDVMFGRLFTYLKDNNLKMTVPVESHMKPASMAFFVVNPDLAAKLRNQGKVKVETIPSRMVISAGLTGRYTKSNFEEGKKMIEKWLKDNPNYEANGEYFAVYWNSPYVPWFMRKQEVNLPVKSLFAESTGKDKN